MNKRNPGKVEPRAVPSLDWYPDYASVPLLAWYEAKREAYSNTDEVTTVHDWSGNNYDLSVIQEHVYFANTDGYPYIHGSPYATLNNSSFPAMGDDSRTIVIAGELSNGVVTFNIGNQGNDNKNFAVAADQMFLWGGGYDFGFTDPFDQGENLVAVVVYDSSTGSFKTYQDGVLFEDRTIPDCDTAAELQLLGWWNFDRSSSTPLYAAAIWDGAFDALEVAAVTAYFTNLMPP
jgi:hypothetical protein